MKSLRTYLCLAGAAFLSFTAACSDSTGTAGVISETESGQTATTDTISGYIYDYGISLEPKKYPIAFVALTKVINGRTIVVDSVTTDSSGDFMFVNAPADAYSIVATFTKNDTTWAGMIRLTPENNYHLISIDKAGTILLSPRYNGLAVGDTLCITGTISCATITKENWNKEFIEISGIPAAYENYAHSTFTQIEIANKEGVRSIPVEWNLSSDGTLIVRDSVFAKVIDEQTVTLPKMDEMDSLSDKMLDSLIIPVFLRTDRTVSYTHDSGFMGDDGSILPFTFGYEHSMDTASSYTYNNFKSVCFVTVPSIKTSSTIKVLYGDPGSINIWPDSRIRFTTRIRATDTLRTQVYRKNLQDMSLFSEDSSFALSFWISINGDTLSDTNKVLFSSLSGNGKTGFEIRQCKNDKQSLCTRIYNGIDSASTSEKEFGKAEILNGEMHYYSLVIHKKHLDINADGKSIHSTDLKLASSFYDLKGFDFADLDFADVLFYSFGNFIRKAGDKNWERLKAWQRAFYELQKTAMETTFERSMKL